MPSGENYDRSEVTCDRRACVARQRSWSWVQDGYQEFTAGTIPVRGVLSDEEGTLVLVEHQCGFMRAFDEHLDAIRKRGAFPLENVDYTVTWTAMTGWEPWPTVIRLELQIDGLRARPRLLFHDGETMSPLWLLADGACSG